VNREKLLQLIDENREKYTTLISEKIKNFIYREKRYGQHFSLTVGLTEVGVDLTDYEEHIRQTDEFIILEDNLCCIILDSTSSESGLKAANNMLAGFQSHHFSKPLYSSVVSSDEYPEEQKLVDELFYVLKYSIKNNMDNIVIDAHSLFKD